MSILLSDNQPIFKTGCVFRTCEGCLHTRGTYFTMENKEHLCSGTNVNTSDNISGTMQKIVDQMKTPAPPHVLDGLCTRLKEIETAESFHGEALANECRSFIYQQEEVKWLDILVTAYLINGGVILREPTQGATPHSVREHPPDTGVGIHKSPLQGQIAREYKASPTISITDTLPPANSPSSAHVAEYKSCIKTQTSTGHSATLNTPSASKTPSNITGVQTNTPASLPPKTPFTSSLSAGAGNTVLANPAAKSNVKPPVVNENNFTDTDIIDIETMVQSLGIVTDKK